VSQLAEVEASEKGKMKAKVEKILKHDVNCFINRQLIYNYPEELFAQAGVMAIEHADFEGIERLAKALGADILSTFDETDKVEYGFAGKIDEIMIGESTILRFSELRAGEACTIVLRGSSKHLLDEAERSLHDALCVLSQMVGETRTVLGAGCSELLMAEAVTKKANATPGKKALAMHGFATALRALPGVIADNAGLDASDLITRLTAEHHNGNKTMGLNIAAGDIGDIAKLKITESFKVKSSVLTYASEAAEMILRADTVLRAVPRQRTM